MSEPKNDEVDEILEQLHEKLLIGWIKNDGKVHTLPSHMNNDGCTDDAKLAINHLIARKEKEAVTRLANEHLSECLVEYAETGTVACYERAKSVFDRKFNEGLERAETLKSKQGE